MLRLTRFLILPVAFALCLTAASSAQADKYTSGAAYGDPTYRELAQAFVVLGGLNPEEPKAIDEYAKLIYCDLYRNKITNEFEWYGIRQDFSKRIMQKKEPYRAQYEIASTIYLGKYNFDTQNFPLVNNSAMVNVGSLLVWSGGKETKKEDNADACKDHPFGDMLPAVFSVQLSQPITFERLSLSTADAEKFLERLQRMNNTERKVYARLRFRLNVAVPLDVSGKRGGRGWFSGEMTGLDLFFDREMTLQFATIDVH